MVKFLKDIVPYVFEDSLIIALDRKWLDAFKKMPKFQAYVGGDDRLVLTSPKLQGSIEGIVEYKIG